MSLLSLKRFVLVLSFTATINGCSLHNHAPISQHREINTSPVSGAYTCLSPEQYINSYIGSGECVDLIKHCTNAPNTDKWKKGKIVFGKKIQKGTAIATFKRSKYPNKKGYHAAIYSHQNNEGIFVWDQWKGQKVHLRLIRANQPHKKPANNANSYSVIRK